MRALPQVSAVALGVVSPEKDKAGVVAGLIGTQKYAVDSRNSETSRPDPQASDELGISEFNRLQRRFSELGFGLYPLTGDSLIATRWGMSKVLHGAGSARAFLAMVGGGRGI
jgi:hypothetical protein